MKKMFCPRVCLLAATALAIVWAGAARAEDTLDAATKARIEAFEKGPATIDISKYPAALKDNYDLFGQKCTQCHKLSRPINSDYCLPSEWSRYVQFRGQADLRVSRV
jgi:cytochrome c5